MSEIGHPVWPKPDLPPADPELLAEQERVGKIMDALDKHERFIAARKDMMHRNESLMLYRLPLTIEQTDRVYNAILADRATK
jgi:hypothetical protein